MTIQFLAISLYLGLCYATNDIVKFSVDLEQGSSDQLRTNHSSWADAAVVTVNVQQALNTVSSHFVGVTVDSHQIRYNWNGLDFSSKKLQNMAQALAPTYFRLGGTAADYMTYDLDNYGNDGGHLRKGEVHCANFTEPYNMTAGQWDALNKFLTVVGWDLILDLNALKRNADGSWNPDNARQLLQYSAERNYTIAGFELGNEYNLYPSKTTVSPAQLAADYSTLRKLLEEFPSSYYSSFLVGPETANDDKKHFEGFLAAGGSRVVRAASFHQYYFSAKEHYLPHFTDIHVMDSLGTMVDSAMSQSREVESLLPVWLSETSTAYGCGTPNMSDRFVAGFLWLDKLGLSAVRGVQSVIRQDFYGFNYGLLDLDMNPNPDFWLTVLYKRIVRGPVFNATASRQDVRVYAACANADNFKAGSLAFYFLNPNNYSVNFDLPQFAKQPLLIYLLSSGDRDGLLSKFSALNGVKLELTGDELPKLTPTSTPHGPVTMGPFSFGFVVLPEARVAICLEQQ